MRTSGLLMLACCVILSSLLTSGALAQNFYELSKNTGCGSVMASLQSECNTLNSNKDRACASGGSCDLDKHIAQISEYKEAQRRLDANEIADADRDSFGQSIQNMKAELDDRKADA